MTTENQRYTAAFNNEIGRHDASLAMARRFRAEQDWKRSEQYIQRARLHWLSAARILKWQIGRMTK